MHHFTFTLELIAVRNHNLASGASRVTAIRFNLTDNFHTFNNLAKDNVLAIQPRGLGGADEELRAVGVGTSVGHGQDTRSFVLQRKVLVSELFSVDAASTGAVVASKVASLAHEVGDDAVEDARLEGHVAALFASAEGTEVFGGFGDDVGAQFHDDAAEGSAVSGDVEEDSGIGHFFRGGVDFRGLKGVRNILEGLLFGLT